MSKRFKDRNPEFPGRVKLTRVPETDDKYFLERDEGRTSGIVDNRVLSDGTLLDAETLNRFEDDLREYAENLGKSADTSKNLEQRSATGDMHSWLPNENGMFYVNAANQINQPPGGEWFHYIGMVHFNPDNGYKRILAYNFYNTSMYVKNCYAREWTDWTEMLTSNSAVPWSALPPPDWRGSDGDGSPWSTERFKSWLADNGYIGENKRGEIMFTWWYAGNAYINDTGCGDVFLSGAHLRIVNSFQNGYTIYITTVPFTSARGSDGATFVYTHKGDGSMGWTRCLTNKDLGTTVPTVDSHVHLGSIFGTGQQTISSMAGYKLLMFICRANGGAQSESFLPTKVFKDLYNSGSARLVISTNTNYMSLYYVNDTTIYIASENFGIIYVVGIN